MEFNLCNTLKEYGCTDLDQTMERFVYDEQFYYEVLSDMLKDTGFERLKFPLLEKNVENSFEIAHSLKGIIGNCGITPMYHTICSIVEPLRAGSIEGLYPKYELLLSQRNQLLSLLITTYDKECFA